MYESIFPSALWFYAYWSYNNSKRNVYEHYTFKILLNDIENNIKQASGYKFLKHFKLNKYFLLNNTVVLTYFTDRTFSFGMDSEVQTLLIFWILDGDRYITKWLVRVGRGEDWSGEGLMPKGGKKHDRWYIWRQDDRIKEEREKCIK